MELKKILLVFSTVLVTLFTAILLNYGAKETSFFSLTAIGIIILVLTINFVKFKVWGTIYRKYHLSESYPLISLFFPLIYIVAIYKEEADFEFSKLLGVFFILGGIWIMNRKNVRI